MSREHRAILTKNYVQLVDEMQSEFMLPYFIQEVSKVLAFSLHYKLLVVSNYAGTSMKVA